MMRTQLKQTHVVRPYAYVSRRWWVKSSSGRKFAFERDGTPPLKDDHPTLKDQVLGAERRSKKALKVAVTPEADFNLRKRLIQMRSLEEVCWQNAKWDYLKWRLFSLRFNIVRPEMLPRLQFKQDTTAQWVIWSLMVAWACTMVFMVHWQEWWDICDKNTILNDDSLSENEKKTKLRELQKLRVMTHNNHKKQELSAIMVALRKSFKDPNNFVLSVQSLDHDARLLKYAMECYERTKELEKEKKLNHNNHDDEESQRLNMSNDDPWSDDEILSFEEDGLVSEKKDQKTSKNWFVWLLNELKRLRHVESEGIHTPEFHEWMKNIYEDSEYPWDHCLLPPKYNPDVRVKDLAKYKEYEVKNRYRLVCDSETYTEAWMGQYYRPNNEGETYYRSLETLGNVTGDRLTDHMEDHRDESELSRDELLRKTLLRFQTKNIQSMESRARAVKKKREWETRRQAGLSGNEEDDYDGGVEPEESEWGDWRDLPLDHPRRKIHQKYRDWKEIGFIVQSMHQMCHFLLPPMDKFYTQSHAKMMECSLFSDRYVNQFRSVFTFREEEVDRRDLASIKIEIGMKTYYLRPQINPDTGESDLSKWSVEVLSVPWLGPWAWILEYRTNTVKRWWYGIDPHLYRVDFEIDFNHANHFKWPPNHRRFKRFRRKWHRQMCIPPPDFDSLHSTVLDVRKEYEKRGPLPPWGTRWLYNRRLKKQARYE